MSSPTKNSPQILSSNAVLAAQRGTSRRNHREPDSAGSAAQAPLRPPHHDRGMTRKKSDIWSQKMAIPWVKSLEFR